jgi:peptide/nickel transport system substrate-binding protein
MKLLLVFILAFALTSLIQNYSFAEKSTFFDSVKFIQYLDENTALEEVRNGNLDIYYYRITSDRLENQRLREGLQVFDSTGGSYSILVNPAESEDFNPFSIREVRFALNYLIDRKLIVNELLGGYGAPMISHYGPSDPEYLTIIKQLETFNFTYNPILAEEMISNALKEKGATKSDGKWNIDNKPIEITIFIRSDDPVRKSIGEIFASELEKIGFTVKKDMGDLNKAYVVVYGSDPAELKWSLYTEGWSRSAFVKYDSVGLAQMYAPWFSNMPGSGNPSYWNYKNEKLDEITQKIYSGDFESEEQRADLVQSAITEGVKESVRIFIASKIDQYVANEKMEGIVNDLGAGVPNRFTPINSRNDDKELVIGVKQINQGAWNPVMGLSDTYSRQIWGIISDPITFKHPFTGETFPVRADWDVETAGPNGKLNLPEDAIMWDPVEQRWKNVRPKNGHE